jgi:hypothetical protein
MSLIHDIMNEMQEFVTKGATTIDSDHSNIHKGLGAIAGDYLQMTAGEVKTYCFTCPIDSYQHFKNLRLDVLGSTVKLEILMGADVTVNTGTAVPISNPNDASTTVPAPTIKEDPTFTGGTIMELINRLVVQA